MGREAASALLTITVLDPIFSAIALPGDSSTPELRSNVDVSGVTWHTSQDLSDISAKIPRDVVKEGMNTGGEHKKSASRAGPIWSAMIRPVFSLAPFQILCMCGTSPE